MKYDLVFEGGGAKGMVFVGALQEFVAQGHEHGRLLGTSAGAITATLLAAGYTPEEMLEAMAEKDESGKSVFAGFMGTPPPYSEAEIEALMAPGARISALQAAGRAVYRRHGLSLAEDALIFFHGLGLSHLDQEVDAEGAVTGDFAVQAGMAIATHIYYPGDRRERMWLEDIAVVGNAGPAESIFGWDFLPHGLDG